MYFKTFTLHGLIFILLVLRILHNHLDLYLKIPKEINRGSLLMKKLGVTFSLPCLSFQFLSLLFIGCKVYHITYQFKALIIFFKFHRSYEVFDQLT